jgi:SAM-dependent methyltransferase
VINKKSQDIINAAGAYEKSRIILTACELDLFTQIHKGINTVEKLASISRLNSNATGRLLDCLVSFNLLEKNMYQYEITENGLFLSAANPENMLPLIKILSSSWNNWSHLTEIIRTGSHPEQQLFYRGIKKTGKDFIELMHGLSSHIAAESAEIYDLSKFHNLLDIGGASGTYTVAFLKKNPELRATILDFEYVLPYAAERVKKENLTSRIKLKSGDYNRDPLPTGFDLVLLSDIIGQNSDSQNKDLFNKIFHILPSRGVLLIRDYVMNESHTYPPGGTLFSMLMLVENQGVGAYSYNEYKKLLRGAGFSEINLIRKGEIKNSLIEAKK